MILSSLYSSFVRAPLRAMVLAVCLLPASFHGAQARDVRIGILIDAATLHVSCTSNAVIREERSGRESVLTENTDALARPRGDGIAIDGREYAAPVLLAPAKNGDPVRVNGRRYRGSVRLAVRGGKLTAINILDMEHYLYGILPREVDPGWSQESLKAQAVVSRTYALRNLRKHDAAGFDLCSQTHCQVFGGMESEKQQSNEAVDATAHEILTFEGQPAQTLFHAACAGHTEDPCNVWSWNQKPPKYLEGRRDKYCGNSPHSSWKNRVSGETLRKKLSAAGYQVGKISRIQTVGKTQADRADRIRIKHAKGTLMIPAARFRMAVDPWIIKSTHINAIVRYGGSYEFRGSGWGHGVGMCQWGAKEMGDQGHTYQEILRYYYPGTRIDRYEQKL